MTAHSRPPRTPGGARFRAAVARRSAAGEAVFVPFLVAGDPTFEQSVALARVLTESGADALEVGLPFSDPPADGPVVQAADHRALSSGMTTARALSWVARVREFTDIPISLLAYHNLVLQAGIDAFYARAAEVGVDAVLVADLPPEHASASVAAAVQHGVAPVFLASELSTPARLDRIASVCDGYVYALARVGVTGARESVATGLSGALTRMGDHIGLPRLVGFGISSPEHVLAARRAGQFDFTVGRTDI